MPSDEFQEVRAGWKTCPTSIIELGLHMDDSMARWWTAFQIQSPRIDGLFQGREEWDLPAWMEEHLGAIHPELMWEYGPAVKGQGHRW